MNKRLFPEKVKAEKMIERIIEKVNKCDPIAVKMLDTTSYFLDDINSSGGKISFEDYRAMRSQITTLATRFSAECLCK